MSDEQLTVATAHDLESRFILIECKDPLIRERMAAQIVDLPRLMRVEAAALRLLTMVADKGQPMSHPNNQALIQAGDTISVNEGNLWALKWALTAETASEHDK